MPYISNCGTLGDNPTEYCVILKKHDVSKITDIVIKICDDGVHPSSSRKASANPPCFVYWKIQRSKVIENEISAIFVKYFMTLT